MSCALNLRIRLISIVLAMFVASSVVSAYNEYSGNLSLIINGTLMPGHQSTVAVWVNNSGGKDINIEYIRFSGPIDGQNTFLSPYGVFRANSTRVAYFYPRIIALDSNRNYVTDLLGLSDPGANYSLSAEAFYSVTNCAPPDCFKGSFQGKPQQLEVLRFEPVRGIFIFAIGALLILAVIGFGFIGDKLGWKKADQNLVFEHSESKILLGLLYVLVGIADLWTPLGDSALWILAIIAVFVFYVQLSQQKRQKGVHHKDVVGSAYTYMLTPTIFLIFLALFSPLPISFWFILVCFQIVAELTMLEGAKYLSKDDARWLIGFLLGLFIINQLGYPLFEPRIVGTNIMPAYFDYSPTSNQKNGASNYALVSKIVVDVQPPVLPLINRVSIRIPKEYVVMNAESLIDLGLGAGPGALTLQIPTSYVSVSKMAVNVFVSESTELNLQSRYSEYYELNQGNFGYKCVNMTTKNTLDLPVKTYRRTYYSVLKAEPLCLEDGSKTSCVLDPESNYYFFDHKDIAPGEARTLTLCYSKASG